MHKKFRKILSEQKSNDLYDCEINIGNNKIISVQLSCSYILMVFDIAFFIIYNQICKIDCLKIKYAFKFFINLGVFWLRRGHERFIKRVEGSMEPRK